MPMGSLHQFVIVARNREQPQKLANIRNILIENVYGSQETISWFWLAKKKIRTVFTETKLPIDRKMIRSVNAEKSTDFLKNIFSSHENNKPSNINRLTSNSIGIHFGLFLVILNSTTTRKLNVDRTYKNIFRNNSIESLKTMRFEKHWKPWSIDSVLILHWGLIWLSFGPLCKGST